MQQQLPVITFIQSRLNRAINQSLCNPTYSGLPQKLLISFRRCVRKVPSERTLSFNALNVAMQFWNDREHPNRKFLLPLGNYHTQCLAFLRGVTWHTSEVIMDGHKFEIRGPAPSDIRSDFPVRCAFM
ncbi:hypothetical protein D3C87_1401600 [compost metagenome]